jgi:hypothetical protein
MYKSTQEDKRVWFYRDYFVFSGGHLIHSHYYNHVNALPNHRACISFSDREIDEEVREQRTSLWSKSPVPNWQPGKNDIFFLAGVDWQYAFSQNILDFTNPRINLIQHVRHAHQGTELYGYLKERAIRICVSAEVAEAISETGIVNGPVIVIPNGVDLGANADVLKGAQRDSSKGRVLILGYKRPEFAKLLSDNLHQQGIEHEVLSRMVPRETYLEKIAKYSIIVCCPHEEEGFYLPALEAMYMGSLVISPDCVGNRSFCIKGETCMMPEYTVESVASEVMRAITLPSEDRMKFLQAGFAQAKRHSVDKERSSFYQLLQDVGQLW